MLGACPGAFGHLCKGKGQVISVKSDFALCILASRAFQVCRRCRHKKAMEISGNSSQLQCSQSESSLAFGAALKHVDSSQGVSEAAPDLMRRQLKLDRHRSREKDGAFSWDAALRFTLHLAAINSDTLHQATHL